MPSKSKSKRLPAVGKSKKAAMKKSTPRSAAKKENTDMSRPEPKTRDELMAIAEAISKLEDDATKALQASKVGLLQGLDALDQSVVQSFAQGIKQMNQRR